MRFEDAEFYYLQAIDDGEAIKGECEHCGRTGVMVILTDYTIETALNGVEHKKAWWCVDWSVCILEETEQAQEPVLMEMY